MEFGYMSGFRADLFQEIEFAKKHFDFTEITIQPELLKAFDKIQPNLQAMIRNFKVLGHVHWEITNTSDIINNIKILNQLGAKKITIHPFQLLDIKANSSLFNDIAEGLLLDQCELLIENISKAPFNSAQNMSELFEKISAYKFTFDVGHANRISETDKFIEIFSNRIKHIHLHDNIGDLDHIFFEDTQKLDQVFRKIKSFGYDGTILLETFSIYKNNKNYSQEFEEIKELHLKQLEMIKGLLQ